ncbi:MAG TPA: hypothetical protein VIL01_12865 [Thermomicrobiales bacterium]
MSVETSPIVGVAEIEAARRRGVEFLLRHIAEDGAIAGAGRPRISYYRVPWALVVSGETAAAHRTLAWIERTGIGEDGAFHGGVAWDAAANRAFNTYPETVLAYGAWLLRRFDVARRVFAFAAQFQDPATGGVWMYRDRTSPSDPQLLFLTCQFGMSAIITGQLERAIAVGAWLERLWQAQPDLPHVLYTVWTQADGLVTRPPAGEDPRHYVNDAREELQLHYNGGIAAAFLAQLGMATGDSKWLELGRAYQRFSMESTERQFATKQVCKSAWGAGLLFHATRDPEYLPWLRKMGAWFVAEQEADGGWSNTRVLDPDPPLAHRIEITAEFVVHLDTVIGALAAANGLIVT